VKILVSAGADIHANNDEAVRHASRNGHLDVVKYLVSVGANIHAEDDHALIWASERGYLDIVKVFVSAGANIHAKNDEAVRRASVEGHSEVVKYIQSLSEKTATNKEYEQECEICTLPNTRFIKCKTCIYKICVDCRSHLLQNKCPYCRIFF
jgi:ankyrin repeat protein